MKVQGLRLATVAAVLALTTPGLGSAQDSARFIVKFRAGSSPAGIQAVRSAGATVLLRLDGQEAVAARIPVHALPGLQRNPHVEYIEIDALRHAMAADQLVAGGEILPYGLQMVQADLVTSSNEAAKKICIIDSGYSQQHVDLSDDDGDASSDPLTYQETSGAGTWDQDSCGHGSHVAGTALATAGNGTGVIGIVPGARLHVVKVLGGDDPASGGCEWTYASTLVAALDHCVASGADVVNMSLGGVMRSRTEELAFDEAQARGVLSIAAAGNAGNRRTSFPAGYDSVVSVAAVDAAETVASFSQRNRDVEIAAPGVGVLSTVPWATPTVTIDAGPVYLASHIENAPRAIASGAIVDGGLCDVIVPASGQVVLCERGVISFFEKVENVQNGGGAVVVIYNNAPGGFAGTLGDGNGSSIPVVGISREDGRAIVASHLGASTTVTDTLRPGGGYEAWGGTSMAAPHVAGVAALVWSCHPDATSAQIRSALDATAKDRGVAGWDVAYGHGIVQAKAAVESLGASAFCTTSTDSKY